MKREEVINYPTDFAPMSQRDLELPSTRGEQLTHMIIDRYLSSLARKDVAQWRCLDSDVTS